MKHQLGYCTNVHAGANLDDTCENLRQHALAVKQAVRPDGPLGIGLWLSASAARELRQDRRLGEFQVWLETAGLVPFTFNGFPYGDFHRSVVKHHVYRPTWADPARLEYTLDLIAIQDRLLPPGMEGSISTLPLQWGHPRPTPDELAESARNLAAVAAHLERLRDRTGRRICVCLEPEPGCVLEHSSDVVRFFERVLLPGRDGCAIREHVRVCHDVCHAAVMFEDQAEAIGRYRAAGIGIGKVQVSSAVVADLDGLAGDERSRALAQLAEFDERRYLHQTCVRPTKDATPVFFEDLPLALRSGGQHLRQGQWRVHFHVPIYVERFGLLATSSSAISECLQAVQECAELGHLEIETYAWTVLPQALRQPTLADGIAAEIRWFQSLAAAVSSGTSHKNLQAACRE